MTTDRGKSMALQSSSFDEVRTQVKKYQRTRKEPSILISNFHYLEKEKMNQSQEGINTNTIIVTSQCAAIHRANARKLSKDKSLQGNLTIALEILCKCGDALEVKLI
jgi:hypothetical protein